MNALLYDEKARDLPAVRAWFAHAEATRRIVREIYGHLPGLAQEEAAVAQNVLVQIENLKTHPCVLTALARGDLHIYGWVYRLETGEVFSYDPAQGRFVSLTEQEPTPTLPATALGSVVG
jgi:carbonic anhydrase